MIWKTQVVVLLAAAFIDWLFGDPPNRWHPVAWMGRFIGRLEARAPARGPLAQFLYGTSLVLLGLILFTLPLHLLGSFLRKTNAIVQLGVNALLLKATFSYRTLSRAAGEVRGALAAGNLKEAQRLAAWHLVSRDTSLLNAGLVTAAVVESVAENVTDSFVAPLLFYILGGLPAAWTYRFLNTCDSMLGYQDPAHEYLGKFAARADDVVNFIPARLAACLLVVSAWLAGEKGVGAWQTMRTQHERPASLNAGWTMSAMAGALSVTLEKVGRYRLEGGGAPLLPETIDSALRVAGLAAMLHLGLCIVLLGALAYVYPS